MANIKIRKATAADLPAIHVLVTELAVYEKEPEAVTATLEDYQQDFAAGIFRAYVAEAEDAVVGMTLYYLAYSTWKGRMLYLEDFVVTQAYRRSGVGKLLFDALIAEAKQLGAARMKWQVLDWNEPAINFYKKYNAHIEDGWLNCNLSKAQLEGMD